MDVKISKKYYKRSRPGEEPMKYKARQPRGVGTTVHAEVYMDPVLKKHPDLRKELLKHEMVEIRSWGEGSTRGHSKARGRESKPIREIGGVSGFWREIKKRER